MMQAWADYLDELRDAGKVAPLRCENAYARCANAAYSFALGHAGGYGAFKHVIFQKCFSICFHIERASLTNVPILPNENSHLYHLGNQHVDGQCATDRIK